MRKRLSLLITSSRPIVWLWFAAPFILGGLLSGTETSNLLLWLEFLALGPLYCLVVYGVNDVYDYETDLQNERKGEGRSQGDILKPEHHEFVMNSSIVASVVLVLIAFATRNIVNIAGMLFLILWAFAYSAPPIRLKERPVLDSISNGLGYLLVPFAMGFSFGSSLTALPESAYWAGLVIAGIHAMFAVLDYKPDKKAGVNTIAVKFGPRKTMLFPVTAILLALVFSPMEGTVAYTLLAALLVLNTLIALDVYDIIDFKKFYRDQSLGAVYLLGIVLVTYFLLQQRPGII